MASQAVWGKMRSFGRAVFFFFFDGFSNSATIPKLITADVITAIVVHFKANSIALDMTLQRKSNSTADAQKCDLKYEI